MLAASSRPPAGLGLDWPEHGDILDWIGAGGAGHIIGKFKPVALDEIHAAGDTQRIYQNMALLTLDLLARIIAMRIDAGPPFSALFTLWLSMMAAVGLASRSAFSRHSV